MANLFKKKGFTWHRIRKSVKSQQDAVLFACFKQEIALLDDLASSGEIQVWYGDESAFQLNPTSTYAWQAKESKLSLPAQRGSVLNVFGFITKDLQSAFYEFKGSMNQGLLIEKIEHFISHYVTKKTVLILDKSPTHTRKAVLEKMKDWKKRNLFIYFLSTASSELNKIEIVWRFIKHHWLSVHDWISVHKLKRNC